ncbi:MAG: ABC transporter ATP-binding protein [Firmicutes bacterium HGW-Firmicutes-3]|nr:MAG: ABC transporter ATP-binding protein [Firmicutes bacterium HGW-Firmicutes-3]
MLKKLGKNQKGFTLIELIVVIAILGILAAILIPRFGGFQDKARGAQATVDGKQIATAIDSLLAEDDTITYTATQVMAIADKSGDIAARQGYSLTVGCATTAGDRGFTLIQTHGAGASLVTFTVTRTAAGVITMVIS